MTDRGPRPDVEIKLDYWRFVIAELSANGFGSPETLANERADLICDAYDYLKFKNRYEAEAIEMRREK